MNMGEEIREFCKTWMEDGRDPKAAFLWLMSEAVALCYTFSDDPRKEIQITVEDMCNTSDKLLEKIRKEEGV